MPRTAHLWCHGTQEAGTQEAGTQEAGTRSPYVRYGGPGAYVSTQLAHGCSTARPRCSRQYVATSSTTYHGRRSADRRRGVDMPPGARGAGESCDSWSCDSLFSVTFNFPSPGNPTLTYRETTQTGCPWPRPRVSPAFLYLSLSIYPQPVIPGSRSRSLFRFGVEADTAIRSASAGPARTGGAAPVALPG